MEKAENGIYQQKGNMFMENNELFWEASVGELKRGYVFKERAGYVCRVCGMSFEKGVIHQSDGRMVDACRAMEEHIVRTHGSVLDVLRGMDRKYNGLTGNRKTLACLLSEGLSDKEIAIRLKTSTSTIRNQRFMFREKKKRQKSSWS
jgi:hypothetical protein